MTRDLPPPPDGFRVDFFCIGAQKSRSTWLAACLRDHPEIAVSRLKETNHFVKAPWMFSKKENPRYLRGWDWYMHEFGHAKPAQRIGDMSAALFHNHPDAPRLLKQYFPEAKLVLTLRDPVARTYSHYWQRAWNPKLETVPLGVEEAVVSDEMLRLSRYHEQYAAWREYFDADAFHVLLDFEIDADPEGAMAGLYAFLGVSPHVPEHLGKVVHQSGQDRRWTAKMRKAGKALQRARLGPIVRIGQWLRINRLVVKMNRKPRSYPALPADTAARIYEALAPDIDAFEADLGRPLDAWRTKYQARDEAA